LWRPYDEQKPDLTYPPPKLPGFLRRRWWRSSRSSGRLLLLLLLNVSGGSFTSITGALVRFNGTGGNALSVTNSLTPTGFLNGVPVFSSLGGTKGFTVTNLTPLVGLSTLGTLTINGTPLLPGAKTASGSLIAIQGTGGTVKIGQ